MKVFATLSLSILFLASCQESNNGCGPFEPPRDKTVSKQLTIAVPVDVDSIIFDDRPSRPATSEIIRVNSADSIRFEFTLINSIVGTELSVSLTPEIVTEWRALYIRATLVSDRAASTGRSRVECDPLGSDVYITHAKVFMPEGLNITIGRF